MTLIRYIRPELERRRSPVGTEVCSVQTPVTRGCVDIKLKLSNTGVSDED